MSTAEEDRWSDEPIIPGYIVEQRPKSELDEVTRQEAMQAVLDAMENYKEPTGLERVREWLWVRFYMLRVRLAMFVYLTYVGLSKQQPTDRKALDFANWLWAKLGI